MSIFSFLFGKKKQTSTSKIYFWKDIGPAYYLELEQISTIEFKGNRLVMGHRSIQKQLVSKNLNKTKYSLFSTIKNNPVKKPKKFFTHIKGSSSIYLTKEQLKGFDIC